jgi:cell division protein ZapA (FtsZ GTPase activity inhibitor)
VEKYVDCQGIWFVMQKMNMKKTVRVKIGGQEYNLRSDDETKVRDVATMVDTQFRMIQGTSKEQSTATLSILTALNIAEQEYDARQQQQCDKHYLASEIEKMVAYLRQSFGDKVIGEKMIQEKAPQEKPSQEKSSQEKPPMTAAAAIALASKADKI